MNTRKANTFGMLERSNLAADISSLLRRSIVQSGRRHLQPTAKIHRKG